MAKTTKRDRQGRVRENPYTQWDQTSTEVSHSVLGGVWRWRTEIGTIIVGLGGFGLLVNHTSPLSALLVIIAFAAVLFGVSPIRRFVMPRVWCVITRHRLQRCFFETRLHTRFGKLPLIMWTRPTKVGERALVWCRPGMCVEDFEAHREELRTACMATEARVIRNQRWSQLVTINIVRHDPLAAKEIVPPHVTAPSGNGGRRGELITRN